MACIIISTQDLRGYGVNRCYGTYTTCTMATRTRRVGILADQDMGRTPRKTPLPGVRTRSNLHTTVHPPIQATRVTFATTIAIQASGFRGTSALPPQHLISAACPAMLAHFGILREADAAAAPRCVKRLQDQ